MNSQQVYQLEEGVQQVHNSLANALVSLRFIRANLEAFAPERRVIIEKEWHRVLTEAVINLKLALALLEPQ